MIVVYFIDVHQNYLIGTNHMNEITYPFQNLNGATVEVWKGISNFIPHYIVDLITYPCRD